MRASLRAIAAAVVTIASRGAALTRAESNRRAHGNAPPPAFDPTQIDTHCPLCALGAASCLGSALSPSPSTPKAMKAFGVFGDHHERRSR